MKNGDIVTVVTVSGEYVGKLSLLDGSFITIDQPRMILSNPETGQMGFARGIAVTGVENPKDVTFTNVVFVTPTNDKVREAYQEATSSIVTPTTPTLVK
ncbi:MAG: hypothetical protein CBD42_000310 [Gammaproteobacteria bacterium TMED182]|nr:hypothetical protein [Gammaproteobacteria bacterium]RPG57126.1 MAG: hypothetical protein CBD42_000310 [Gammaproteobacteria bacterium TMED182]